jgi:phosphoribosyl-ATP pyrophosphohydrolase/phosphoribosyl-AMP cyclohydrolase
MTVWSRLKPDAAGLVVAVVQHADTDQVLMVGYMNEEALEATLSSRKVTFWSRSRNELWEKGATSGHTLWFDALRVDCDGDALLVRARPVGPTCHLGKTSCFFRPVGAEEDDGPVTSADVTMGRVFGVVLERQAGRGATNSDGKSYVRSLLEGGPAKVTAKIREEADELCRAIIGEPVDRVAAETADLVFHAMVGLALRAAHWRDVGEVLAKRLGVSGVDEKASRG